MRSTAEACSVCMYTVNGTELKLKEMKQIINHNRNDIVKVGRMCVKAFPWFTTFLRRSKFDQKQRQMTKWSTTTS